MTIRRHRFSDIQIELKTDSSGNITLVEGVDSITQSIKTILSTSRGERVMLPDFGCSMKDFLFEPMSEITIERMEIEIQRAIEDWEDRIIIHQIKITPDEDNNIYDITIDYRLRTTGQRGAFHGRVQAAVG